jgi:hypothetical protein
MPVDFLEISRQIAEKGLKAGEFLHAHLELRSKASYLLNQYSADIGLLQQLVQKAVAANSSLRCAVPVHESLTFSTGAEPVSYPYTVLAADGSQVNPSRHDQIEFGVINVGTYRMLPGQQEPPKEQIKSELLALDDLVTKEGFPIGEELVSLRRDLFERRILCEIASSEKNPVVALTDGPLELFREPRGEALNYQKEYTELLNIYLGTLETMADQNTAVAGYVDRPKSDLVVRLLELSLIQPDQTGSSGNNRALRGIADSELFSSILKPGERSAIFAIQSPALKIFTNRLALHFFYINTGYENHHSIARVEIPKWVAGNEQLMTLLHYALVYQCKIMGTRPYPYAVHRAHEVAVVSFDEKRKIMDMIAAEWYRQGMEVGYGSNKQAGKDISGARKRYKNDIN